MSWFSSLTRACGVTGPSSCTSEWEKSTSQPRAVNLCSVAGLGRVELPTRDLGNLSHFVILLARFAFTCVLEARFSSYSGVSVPKLFLSFA